MRLAALTSVLLLAGCSGSGFWRYQEDTLTLPGANPNMPVSAGENFNRARGAKLNDPAVELTEAGDIWPGPPAPVPTLKQLQKQQMADLNNENGPQLSPLPPLPSLPGYEISEQEPSRPLPPSALASVGGRRGIAVPPATSLQIKSTTDTGPIIVPNGNGTSTVISPNGAVSTIPTPK